MGVAAFPASVVHCQRNGFWMRSADTGVQVGQEGCHLLVGEASRECRHHSLPVQDYVCDFSVGCGGAAEELGATKQAVQIRRNLLQGEIVIAVTVRATDFVEVLAFSLLRGERWSGVAGVHGGCRHKCKKDDNRAQRTLHVLIVMHGLRPSRKWILESARGRLCKHWTDS